MNDMKQRVLYAGVKYSKIAELIGVGKDHFSRVLNDRGAFFSPETYEKFDKLMTKIENAIQ